jgi:hypothetical protein
MVQDGCIARPNYFYSKTISKNMRVSYGGADFKAFSFGSFSFYRKKKMNK